MSIYATGWTIQVPHLASSLSDPVWVEVTAQFVPSHIGSKTLGDYDSDPYGDFLPPPIENAEDEEVPRAVVFVTSASVKEGQRYVHPLLTLPGYEYLALSFQELLRMLMTAVKESVPLD